MTMKSLKERIRQHIYEDDYVSFASLSNRFGAEFSGGDQAITLLENIILWANMTPAAAKAISELLDEKAIEPQVSSVLVYLIDGHGLTFPVAKSARQYKKPHWLPIVLRPATDRG